MREALLSEAEHVAHMGSWVWDVSTNGRAVPTERIETGRAVRSAVLAKPFRLPELTAALDELLKD